MNIQEVMHEKPDRSSAKFEETKVLVVEDQEDMQEMMVTFLRDMGLTRVVAVDNGLQAIRHINRSIGHLDLVICDWNIPQKDGSDVLRELRLLRPDMPFLMVTGRTDMDSVFIAQKLGVTSYLSKPFSAKEFEKRLRTLMSGC